MQTTYTGHPALMPGANVTLFLYVAIIRGSAIYRALTKINDLYEFTFHLVLGDIAAIRSYAYLVAGHSP